MGGKGERVNRRVSVKFQEIWKKDEKWQKGKERRKGGYGKVGEGFEQNKWEDERK